MDYLLHPTLGTTGEKGARPSLSIWHPQAPSPCSPFPPLRMLPHTKQLCLPLPLLLSGCSPFLAPVLSPCAAQGPSSSLYLRAGGPSPLLPHRGSWGLPWLCPGPEVMGRVPTPLVLASIHVLGTRCPVANHGTASPAAFLSPCQQTCVAWASSGGLPPNPMWHERCGREGMSLACVCSPAQNWQQLPNFGH